MPHPAERFPARPVTFGRPPQMLKPNFNVDANAFLRGEAFRSGRTGYGKTKNVVIPNPLLRVRNPSSV